MPTVVITELGLQTMEKIKKEESVVTIERVSYDSEDSIHSTSTHCDSENIHSTRQNTIRSLLDGYGSLSVSELLRPLSSDFTHRVLPSSLGIPVRDKQSFSTHAKGIFSIFDSFRMVPRSMYEDEAEGVIVVHAQMEGLLSQTKRGWINECVMMIRLSADGREVTEIQEFVDSWKAMEMRKGYGSKHFGGGESVMVIDAVRGALLVTCLAASVFLGRRISQLLR